MTAYAGTSLTDCVNVGCTLKSAAEIEKMRIAGRHVAEVLFEIRSRVRPGVTTGDLNRVAEREVKKRGLESAFLGYRPTRRYTPYPGIICSSVNDEVVHGIPADDRVLNDGDIVSVDFAIFYDGYCGDAATTIPVGQVSKATRKFLRISETALTLGIMQCWPDKRLGDLGHAIQVYVEKHGYSVVRDYVGHGIGREMHESPSVPNYGKPGAGMRLQEGMVLAIEPMTNVGRYDVRVGKDGWVVRTADGKPSAHFEHTVAITADGPRR